MTSAARAMPAGGGHRRPRRLQSATHDTAFGPFTILADGDGVVHAAGWTTEPAALLALVAAPLRPAGEPGARRELGAASAAGVGKRWVRVASGRASG